MEYEDDVVVLLSTYNGSQYINAQLDSILNQTLPPDKVIISDDCSADNTVDIVKNFILSNGLSNHWFIKSNPKNKGWRLNFHELLADVSSKFVFLCDQDDIWRVDKLEIMLSVINHNHEINLLSSNVNEFSNDAQLTEKFCTGINKIYQWDFSFINDIQRPGCTYLIRSDFIKNVNILNSDPGLNAHDALLWSSACAGGSLYNIDMTTIDWRRHHLSATLNNNKLKSFSESILDHKRTVARFTISLSFCENEFYREKLISLLKFYQLRLEFVKKRKFISLIFLTFKNYSFFKGKKDLVNDFYSLLFLK